MHEEEPITAGPEDAEGAGGAEAAAAEAAERHEENAMIDVHAPHGGLHTWKDFWIHLGTITLGLLIAIGLEQTVEYVHHLHQRHQLEEDLRAEAEKNLAIMDDDYRYFDALLAQVAANRERVDAMRAGGKGQADLSSLQKPSRQWNWVTDSARLRVDDGQGERSGGAAATRAGKVL